MGESPREKELLTRIAAVAVILAASIFLVIFFLRISENESKPELTDAHQSEGWEEIGWLRRGSGSCVHKLFKRVDEKEGNVIYMAVGNSSCALEVIPQNKSQ